MSLLLLNRPARANAVMILLPTSERSHHFVTGEIEDHMANLIVAQLLFLESEDPDKISISTSIALAQCECGLAL